jgi:hypothetical protein
MIWYETIPVVIEAKRAKLNVKNPEAVNAAGCCVTRKYN